LVIFAEKVHRIANVNILRKDNKYELFDWFELLRKC